MKQRLGLVLFRYFCQLSVLILLTGVIILLYFLVKNGYSTLNLTLIFGNTPILPAILGKLSVWQGIWPALIGTLSLVILALLLALLPGICCGIFLAEYASVSVKRWCTNLVDILAGTPSIVMGLFGFILILFLRNTYWPNANTGLLLAAMCLALLVLPVIIVTTKEALESISPSLRITAKSLGMTKNQYVRYLLLPSASKGILAGIILAIGRCAEDTAVIMLTGVVANSGLPAGIFGKFEALSFHIYITAAEYQSDNELAQGFSTALVLLMLSVILMIGARWLEKRYKAIRYNH